MYANGFVKVAAASIKTKVGDAMANAKEIVKLLDEIEKKKAAITIFPELCICGYSAGDLMFQEYLYRDNLEAIQYILENNPYSGVAIIGTFFFIDDKPFNCCAVIQKDNILAVVPKSYLPHTYEFSESRWFVSGYDASCNVINLFGKEIPFGRFVFTNEDRMVNFGVEICEDFWAPFSPHEILYANGAMMVFNASASPEVVGKREKRSQIAETLTYKSKGAYIYTSTNASESTSEVVFSNHKMIYENGDKIVDMNIINLESDVVYGDIDISMLHYQRRSSSWVKNTHGKIEELCKIEYHLEESSSYELEREIDLLPFVPKKEEDLHLIIDMQAVSLKKRLDYIGISKVVLGVSGGLDSTLALLVCAYMCDKYDIPRTNIIACTLPSENTSSVTYQNALLLMDKLKVTAIDYDINEDVNRQIKLIEHSGEKDTTYENIQARFRTYTLMNLANLHNAIVIGTSDMSEVALGWSTFNGDQSAMYGINSGITKTVVRALVRYMKQIYPDLEKVLDSVLETPITPELTGEKQLTEEVIGKYEINDFILYRFLYHGDTEKRLIFLLNKLFNISKKEAEDYVNNFFNRFYTQQFKRLTMPEGVKLLKIGLSPRTELRLNGDIYRPKKRFHK
ncbi:MAG TPA: NAD(+) synthase [Acholeplasmataceae bacterium]|nr:NAD(+) synthase [Acholeplasmataceae bacterium]